MADLIVPRRDELVAGAGGAASQRYIEFYEALGAKSNNANADIDDVILALTGSMLMPAVARTESALFEQSKLQDTLAADILSLTNIVGAQNSQIGALLAQIDTLVKENRDLTNLIASK